MLFHLHPTSKVVEASFSLAPEDVNVAAISIEAWPDSGESLADLVSIDVELAVDGVDRLTADPEAVTMHSDRPDQWEIERSAHPGSYGIRPRADAAPPVPGAQPWRFTIRDVAVDTAVGTSNITIREHRSGRAVASETVLVLRKVEPGLRIDRFWTVETPETDDSDADESESEAPKVIEPRVETPGGSIRLAWATTAADTVRLFGPDGEVPDAVPQPPLTNHDHHYDVKPDTTSTYTLVASRAGGGHEVRQLTVTVADRLVARRLRGVASGDPPGDPVLDVIGDLRMKPGTTVTTQYLDVSERVESYVHQADGTITTTDLSVGTVMSLPMGPHSTLTTRLLEVTHLDGDVVVEGELHVQRSTNSVVGVPGTRNGSIRVPAPGPASLGPRLGLRLQRSTPLVIVPADPPADGDAPGEIPDDGGDDADGETVDDPAAEIPGDEGVARLQIGLWALVAKGNELIVCPLSRGTYWRFVAENGQISSVPTSRTDPPAWSQEQRRLW